MKRATTLFTDTALVGGAGAMREAQPIRVLSAVRRAANDSDDVALQPLRATPRLTASPEAFVGRGEEIAMLTTALDDAARGRGRAVFVHGTRGIGKSRLAQEAARLAVGRGFVVGWGGSWEPGGAPAFWPWVQALRSLSRELDSERLAPPTRKRLAALLTELDTAGGPELRRRTHSRQADVTSAARFQRLDSFSSALCELAAVAPIMIVLDDLQAADEGTLALLSFVTRQLHSAKVIVLGAQRDSDTQHSPHAELLARVAQDAHTIPLGPLEPSALRGYLSPEMHASKADALAEALHKRTDGHPLVIREFLRRLATDTATPVESLGAPRCPRLSLSLDGGGWLVIFDRQALRCRDSKGMRFLAALTAQAGCDVHVLDLAAPTRERATDAPAQDVLDEAARAAYRERIDDLRAELGEAEQWNDAGRAERIAGELAALTAELSRAVGLGGRSRCFATDAERARVNVQRRIRDAIRRLGAQHEGLGRHLDRAVRTGMRCAYDPE